MRAPAAVHNNTPTTALLFGFTLFVSAALMFALQPMTGRMLLPLVGGTPAGWIVTMAFFQVMLLLGYLLAHGLSRFSPRAHGLVFAAALVCGMLFLPPHIAPPAGGGVADAFDIFRLLAAAVGVPFVAVAAASSTLQRLFTVTGHDNARDPYFLYAASNLGSFAGLFLYPLAAEPLLGLSAQAFLWLCGYGALFALVLLCLLAAQQDAPAQDSDINATAITGADRLRWVLLAFVPSSLLMGVTTHISTDIFSAPLLWVLPLGLYLLTFVAAFARKQPVSLAAAQHLHPIVVALAIGLLLSYNAAIRVSWFSMSFHLLAFGVTALMCHLRLAALRPADSRRHLTGFYLMISVGGALGGLLNAFVVPQVLDRLAEYPAMLIVSLLLNPAFGKKPPASGKAAMLVAGGLIVFYLLVVTGRAVFGQTGAFGIIGAQVMMVDIVLAAIFVTLALNIRAAFFGCALMLVMAEAMSSGSMISSTRNFFGVVKIFDRPMQIDGKPVMARYMYHGTTTHGLQVLDPAYETRPTSYFSENGPAGNVFLLYNPADIAVIGLGTGTLHCYSTPQTAFTFIEIDRSVVDAATRHFTFLSACKGRAAPRIITGDGRLALENLAAEKFDIIVMDAFSSDTIPVHLLTAEAMTLYRDRLKPRGMILVNLSNRYFNLMPAVIRTAESIGLQSRFRIDASWNKPYAAASQWVVLAGPEADLSPLEQLDWHAVLPDASRPVWTDDYSNLPGALRIVQSR